MPACSVADQFCLAPANFEKNLLPKRLGTCFCCGQDICSRCSSKRKYYNYGLVRLCNDCHEAYDGNDEIVMKRLEKMANAQN